MNKNCPIALIFERHNTPSATNTIKRLLPFFKQQGFKFLAIEEVSGVDLDLIINAYFIGAFQEVMGLSGEEYYWKRGLYQLLNNAKKDDFSILPMDLNIHEYHKIQPLHAKAWQKLALHVESKVNHLKQELESHYADKTKIHQTINNLRSLDLGNNTEMHKARNDLLEDYYAAHFSSNVDERIIKLIVEYTYRTEWYRSQELISMVETIKAFDFFSRRSAHFVEQIDNLCSKNEGGVISLMDEMHGKVALHLSKKGYSNIHSFLVSRNLDNKYFIDNLIKFNPEYTETQLFFNTTYLYQNTLSLNQIDQVIQQSIIGDISYNEQEVSFTDFY